MASFMGGSAYAMANQIAEGYILVSAATFRRFKKPEMKSLETEIDKLLREIRGDQPALDDLPAIQKRNRKMSRLNQATQILRHQLQAK